MIAGRLTFSDNKRRPWIGAASLTAALFLAAHAHAQVMYSFESGLEGWSNNTAESTLSTSAFGATDGTSALLISDITGGFKNDPAFISPVDPGTYAFQAFLLASDEIAKGNRPKFEFDFTLDSSGATGLPAFTQLAVFMNSRAGFKDYGTGGLIGGNIGGVDPDIYPRLDPLAASHGVTLTNIGTNKYHVAIPMRFPSEVPGTNQGLTIARGTAAGEDPYYQLGFKFNSGYTGTIKYGVDNIRFTGIPTFSAQTLFSWETSDNAGTPGVNEAFEGWVTTNELPSPPAGVTLQPGHAQSIVATGATDGTKAYQIDRTSVTSGFTWGSVFALSGTGNPANQTKINDYVTKFNSADRIAIDVTTKDQFPPISPSFTGFTLHVADGTGAFYQADLGAIDLTHAGAETLTLEVPLSAFVDVNASADFNQDTQVDGLDLGIWRTAFGSTAAGDADGDGKSDGLDFLIWQGRTKNLAVDGLKVGATFFEIGLASNTDDGAIYQFDNLRLLTQNPMSAMSNSAAASGAVPEPASWMLVAAMGLLAGQVRRGGRQVK